jgi:glycosyltransferase involved in cell wall biosynthesis
MQAGALPNGARVIYNGVDMFPFLNAAGQRVDQANALRLVYTGSLVEHKGVHTAIEAMGLLRQRGKLAGISLTVVGSGHPEYEVQLHSRVQALGLENLITFRGWVARSEIPRILAEHDVFLFTSEYEEPIARSVMEAMAAALAVIGTAVGGQAEILTDSENALVYLPGNAEQLADAIQMLRCEPDLRARLATAGQKTVEQRFTLDRMIDEMEAWLLKLAAA